MTSTYFGMTHQLIICEDISWTYNHHILNTSNKIVIVKVVTTINQQLMNTMESKGWDFNDRLSTNAHWSQLDGKPTKSIRQIYIIHDSDDPISFIERFQTQTMGIAGIREWDVKLINDKRTVRFRIKQKGIMKNYLSIQDNFLIQQKNIWNIPLSIQDKPSHGQSNYPKFKATVEMNLDYQWTLTHNNPITRIEAVEWNTHRQKSSIPKHSIDSMLAQHDKQSYNEDSNSTMGITIAHDGHNKHNSTLYFRSN